MNKKKINKLLLLLTAFSSAVSLGSCKEEEKKVEEVEFTTGNHEGSVTETDKFLLANSQTEYKLALPAEIVGEMGYARDEFKRFFKEATGIDINVANGDELTYSETSKYISLGQTNFYTTSGLNLDLTKLKRDGYYIKTKGESIFIVGKNNTAVLYGVYEFLHRELGFETYTPNTYELDENVKTLKFKNYDLMDNPDIDMRTRKGYFNPVDFSKQDNVMFAYRTREIDKTENILLPIFEGPAGSSSHNEVHNSYFFVPKGDPLDPNSNINKHPKFFSASGQLCFTCQGDEEELQAMAKMASEHVIDSIKYTGDKGDIDKNVVQFGIVDMTPMCTCASCVACNELYNESNAACIIIFLYKMGRYVEDWMKEQTNPNYIRDMKYMFLAYADSLRPPFVRGDDGKVVVPQALKPYDDVNVMPYCCFSDFDESKGYNDPENDAVRDYVKVWAEVYEGCFAWSYGTFFNDYFAFYDAYSFYADYYKDLATNGYSLTYEQLHSNQKGADTGFHQCIGYCQAKLNWNAELDMDTLIDNYFHAVYGVAYDTMKDIFTTFRIFFQTVIKNIVSNNGANITSDKRIFSENQIGYIKQVMSKFDKAYEDISVFQNDEEEFTRLTYNIDLEWLYPAKVIIDCYKDYFNAADYNAILGKFRKLIETMQIAEHKEFTSISVYLSGLSEK